MRNVLKIIVCLFLFTGICFADGYYAVIEGGTPKGVSWQTDKTLINMQKKYTMIKVGQEFVGKQRYEIKYDGSKVRLATQQEIDDFIQQQEQAAEIVKKQTALNTLGITQTDIDKLKAL